MVQQQARYNDDTPNNFPDDYDESKVDSRVKLRSKAIRGKYRGVDVRGALAQGIEIAGAIAGESVQNASEAKQLATDSASHIDETLAAITDTDTGDAAAETINGRIDTVNGKTYTTIGQNINALRDAVYTPNRGLDIGGDAVSAAVPTFVANIDQSKFNVAVITDGHYSDTDPAAADYPFGKYSLTHLATFAAIVDHCDIGIALGDNANGSQVEHTSTAADLALYADRVLYTPVKGDMAIITGNHDDGSPINYYQTAATAENVLSQADMESILHTADLMFDESRDGSSLYFYKDYPAKKMRVIALYAEDVPEELADAGAYKYPRFLWHGYRQKQLDWLAQTLLSVPDDYTTAVFAHAPLSGTGWTDSDANATYVNCDLVYGLLNAFVAGSLYTQTGASEYKTTGWAASVTADFSKQGPRDLAGFFDGHKHTQQRFDLGSFKLQMLENDFEETVDEVNVDQRGAITVISIDVTAKTVSLIGWGRATDDSFTYGGGE